MPRNRESVPKMLINKAKINTILSNRTQPEIPFGAKINSGVFKDIGLMVSPKHRSCSTCCSKPRFKLPSIGPVYKLDTDSVITASADALAFSSDRPSKDAVMTTWSWWRHQMETFSAVLALCAGNTGLRWISRTKASGTELSCFLWSAPN